MLGGAAALGVCVPLVARVQNPVQLPRKPRQLSGGQQQRVALGRALVRDRFVVLLDEPLSNLDATLRAHLRAELIALRARIRRTFVYVAHDQFEAMTMSDRIVVMHEGVLQQVGPPAEVYGSPANLFVARFIGAPAMNLLRGKAEQGGFAHPALALGLAGTPPGSGRDTLAIRADVEVPLAVGEALRRGVRAARLYLFDAASGARLDASLAPPVAMQA